MDLIGVSSCNLSAVGYDEDSRVLRIRFQKGEIYDYYNVPEFVYQALLEAASKGSYHYDNIRGVYTYNRVS